MQKFSSHVVEKCIKHFAESRPQIIRELISVVHFEQLLQDPFANYVIQSALAVTKVWGMSFLLSFSCFYSICSNFNEISRSSSFHLLYKYVAFCEDV